MNDKIWFNIYIKKDFKKIIDDFANMYKITKTGLILMILKEFFVKNKDKLSIRHQKLLNEQQRKQEMLLKSDKWKITSRYFYLIPNVMKQIFNTAKGYYINSGKINYKVISEIIDRALDVYNTFPDEIKNKMKDDVIELEKWKNKDILEDRIKIMRFLEMQKGKK